MKKVFFICVMVLMNLSMFSQSVDVQTAKSLGTLFMKHNTDLQSVDLSLSYTAVTQKGKPAFYVFSNKGKGFVIVSADNRMRPILGYSGENAFNSENINPELNTFFTNYISTMEYVVDNNLERSSHAKSDWDCLKNTGRLSYNRTNSSVEPLVKTTWNQSDLYNSMCPEDPAGFGGHAKSGCVANAMAQIMNYWEWPQWGEGSYSYQSDYGILEADFENSNYRYELMPDFLDYTTPQAEIDAVALLQYHAGVSVDMMYGPTASGAFSFNVPIAMKYCFRYECGLYTTYLDNLDGGIAEWEAMLRSSLDRKEPLYYAAFGPDGGHAFVCSGYDENNLFHFNWGWQGFDNGYYAIDNFYLTDHDFPYGHEVLFNLRPEYTYYQQPQPVENVMVETDDEALINTITFNVPTQNLNDETIQTIDSIIILRNDNRLFAFNNPVPGETLSFEDHLDKNGVNYYFIYPMCNGLKGKAVIDTIMTGPTCELKFNLYDSDDDGWQSPALSVLDSRGVVVERLKLERGSYDTLLIAVPDNDTLTFFWNYVNAAYSDQDEECSFEIYDKDVMIYQSEGKPEVGEIMDYYMDCEHIGIVENDCNDNVVVYPNPVKDAIYISGVDVNNVAIYNSLGQEFFNDKITGNKLEVDFLDDGLYIVKIQDVDSNVIVKKFVKK